MRQPIKKVVPEPMSTATVEGQIKDGDLLIDVRDTGATTIVTIMNGMPLTPSTRRRLMNRYPGAIIIG